MFPCEISVGKGEGHRAGSQIAFQKLLGCFDVIFLNLPRSKTVDDNLIPPAGIIIIPVGIVVRYLLEKAKDTEQAVTLLMNLPTASNCNILLATAAHTEHPGNKLQIIYACRVTYSLYFFTYLQKG